MFVSVRAHVRALSWCGASLSLPVRDAVQHCLMVDPITSPWAEYFISSYDCVPVVCFVEHEICSL